MEYDEFWDDDWQEDLEDEESLGDCRNFGQELYQEGTEVCEWCPMSEQCFAMYQQWMRDTRGGCTVPIDEEDEEEDFEWD